MKRILICLLAFTGISVAQEPPYDVFPDAEPPYYRVRYEASTQPGELTFAVNYTVWVPPGVTTLKGLIVHQHGCGEGSCKSGLTGAFDLHWQALAKKHGCALMAPSYEQPQEASCLLWCDPRNGSDATFQKSLVDLGNASGHPELSTVPWVLWGHSGGGTWSGTMTLLHPNRVAVAWIRSGTPNTRPRADSPSAELIEISPESLDVPIMLDPGTEEGVTVKDGRFAGVWPRVEQLFLDMRSLGGLVSIAVDPLTSHECGNQRYLAIPWFDAVLAARLPYKSGQPLRPMPTQDIWLAPVLGSKAVPENLFSGDKSKSLWLPNESVAKKWMHYVSDTNIPDTTPPPAPTNIRVVNGDVTWDAEADLESGIAYFAILRDGKQIATVPEDPSNRFGRPLFQGLQYSDTPIQPLVEMRYIDSSTPPRKNYQYRIVSVNTVGLKSE